MYEQVFVGTEIEHTPAYGKTTLFVVGLQNPDKIAKLAESVDADHIYLGANHSYTNTNLMYWESVILELLKRDFWVTLDLDIAEVEGLLESGLPEYRRFIPMISAKLPYIDQLGYNAVLKLDDRDFDHSNFGVWCHRIHDLKSRTVFTEWDEYKDDEVW